MSGKGVCRSAPATPGLVTIVYTSVSRASGKPCHTKKKTPNLFYQIYPILASLKGFITYGKPSEQKILGLAEPLWVYFPNLLLSETSYTLNYFLLLYFGALLLFIMPLKPAYRTSSKQLCILIYILLDFQTSLETGTETIKWDLWSWCTGSSGGAYDWHVVLCDHNDHRYC